MHSYFIMVMCQGQSLGPPKRGTYCAGNWIRFPEQTTLPVHICGVTAGISVTARMGGNCATSVHTDSSSGTKKDVASTPRASEVPAHGR